MADFLTDYAKEFVDHKFTRQSLFVLLRDKYNINKALYLGSHIHITPSLVFPEVVYVDSYKRAARHFASHDLKTYITQNKQYSQPASVRFIHQNYEKPLDIDRDFDLLISQYADFVSQAGKLYLKTGGVLIANDSHGDASMAQLDSEYKFIAVANHTKDRWRINEENIQDYFVPKKDEPISQDALRHKGRGFAYTKTAANYIFRNV